MKHQDERNGMNSKDRNKETKEEKESTEGCRRIGSQVEKVMEKKTSQKNLSRMVILQRNNEDEDSREIKNEEEPTEEVKTGRKVTE